LFDTPSASSSARHDFGEPGRDRVVEARAHDADVQALAVERLGLALVSVLHLNLSGEAENR